MKNFGGKILTERKIGGKIWRKKFLAEKLIFDFEKFWRKKFRSKWKRKQGRARKLKWKRKQGRARKPKWKRKEAQGFKACRGKCQGKPEQMGVLASPHITTSGEGVVAIPEG